MTKKSTARTQLKKVTQEILQCAFCLEHAKGMLVPGEESGISRIVFIGEAPGKEEAKTGRPFIGRAGKVLRSLIHDIGLQEEEVYITSVVKYLPKTYVTPKPLDIEHGRIHLFKQFEALHPKVIVLLGNTACLGVLGQKCSISKEHGKVIKKDARTYFITFHPAAPLYAPKVKPLLVEDFKQLKQGIIS
jgi:DNA polymerase